MPTETPKRPNTGGYAPPELPTVNPLFVRPLRTGAVLRYFFGWSGYLFPWQVLYIGLATLVWWFFMPSLEETRNLKLGWVAQVFAVNMAVIVAWLTFLHVLLHVKKTQGTTYKFNSRWPKDSDTFLFGSQLWDNVFWTVVSAVPFWTAYTVAMFWMMANGWVPYLDLHAHPLYTLLIMCSLSLWHEVHFFSVHRLIHWPPLYKWVHSIHHKNSNPIPWSGLAMHPVEHLLYYSSVLIHLVIPANPLIITHHLLSLNLGAGADHTGFAKFTRKGAEPGQGLGLSSYAHYLHHRYHEVNYGNQGAVPLDKWAGYWHDGSAEDHERMMARFKKNSPPPAGN